MNRHKSIAAIIVKKWFQIHDRKPRDRCLRMVGSTIQMQARAVAAPSTALSGKYTSRKKGAFQTSLLVKCTATNRKANPMAKLTLPNKTCRFFTPVMKKFTTSSNATYIAVKFRPTIQNSKGDSKNSTMRYPGYWTLWRNTCSIIFSEY